MHYSKLYKRKNNLRFYFAFLILICLYLSGHAQTYLKIQHHYFYYDGSAGPRVTISSWHKVRPKIFISTYYYVNPTWSQGMIGFDYSPNPDFMIGFKAGIQSETNVEDKIDVLRLSPFIYYKYKKITFAAIYEIGGIKDRSIALLDYNFNKSTTGLMFLKKQKFLALGPRTDIKIPGTPLYIYVSALFTDKGKFASMSGVYARFSSSKSAATINEIPEVTGQ